MVYMNEIQDEHMIVVVQFRLFVQKFSSIKGTGHHDYHFFFQNNFCILCSSHVLFAMLKSVEVLPRIFLAA